MKRNIIEKTTVAVLIIIISFNAFMLIRIWLLNRDDPLYREKKTEYILPEGFSPEKMKISWDEIFASHSGWVVRYANQGCIYCKLDFEWEHLANYLEKLNYRTIIILPGKTNKFDEDQIVPETAQQMAFVKMDWIKQFRLTGTPEIIIFDNNGRVLWHYEGIMKERNAKSMKKLL